MPNWTTNIVEIEGHKNLLKIFEKIVQSDNLIFDFNNIVPLPAITKYFSGILTQQEKDLIGPYNYSDWVNQHWWTNTIDNIQIVYNNENKITYEFKTTNNPPIPIFIELSRQFKDLTFTICCIFDIQIDMASIKFVLKNCKILSWQDYIYIDTIEHDNIIEEIREWQDTFTGHEKEKYELLELEYPTESDNND